MRGLYSFIWLQGILRPQKQIKVLSHVFYVFFKSFNAQGQSKLQYMDKFLIIIFATLAAGVIHLIVQLIKHITQKRK